MVRNFILLFTALILSYLTASYTGSWYNQISPQYGSVFLGTDTDSAVLFAGALVSHVFFVPSIFGLFGFRKNIRWISILLIPPALLWIFVDIYHIYIPIILALIALGLAVLIRKILKISGYTEPLNP